MSRRRARPRSPVQGRCQRCLYTTVRIPPLWTQWTVRRPGRQAPPCYRSTNDPQRHWSCCVSSRASCANSSNSARTRDRRGDETRKQLLNDDHRHFDRPHHRQTHDPIAIAPHFGGVAGHRVSAVNINAVPRPPNQHDGHDAFLISGRIVSKGGVSVELCGGSRACETPFSLISGLQIPEELRFCVTVVLETNLSLISSARPKTRCVNDSSVGTSSGDFGKCFAYLVIDRSVISRDSWHRVPSARFPLDTSEARQNAPREEARRPRSRTWRALVEWV